MEMPVIKTNANWKRRRRSKAKLATQVTFNLLALATSIPAAIGCAYFIMKWTTDVDIFQLFIDAVL